MAWEGDIPEDEADVLCHACESERYEFRIAALTAAVAKLRAALETVRDGFDCDGDAHKYGTACRCCEARKALDETKETIT